MNARQAAEYGEQLVIELLDSAISMAERTGKTVEEAIDFKVNFYVRKSSSVNEEIAWGIRGEKAKALIAPPATFNVHFNDDNDSNDKGFELSFTEAITYINMYNGTNESYFADYKGGVVSIVSNDTGESVYEQLIK